MAYLIDASSLIESKNRLYAFDVCPGFWDWLIQQNADGRVYSISKIKEELQKGNDDLAIWAKRQGDGFFLPDDAATLDSLRQVSDWVNRSGFKPEAVAEFLSSADLFLVAYAMAHGHTVVTDETLEMERKNKVKIPVVCNAFKVPWISLLSMLRQAGARFVLP